jgi:nifR3 family TIM-barrel protein
MGATADDFVPAALRLIESGFDVIDLNFGCPVKKVLGRQRGGFLLGEPEKALTIVDQVREALPPEVPLTVKMRRGIDDSPESRDHFYTILDGAFAHGIDAVTIHGRTVRQKYEGQSCWEFLREVKQHLGDRVMLGSGDLFTAENCMAMLEQTGVDGVTVARGAIGNPWIFREAKALYEGTPCPAPPTLAEQRAVIMEHYRMTIDLYGMERGVRQMRKFCIKYADLHPHQPEVRAALIAIRRSGELEKVLDEWYGAL